MNKWRSRSWLNIGITQSRTFEVQLGDAGVHSCRLTQCWVSPMPENNQKQKNGSTQKPKGKRCFEASVLNHLCISTRPHVRIWVLYTVCSWWQSYGQRIGCCVAPKKLQKYAEHPWLYPILHSHSMDGRSTAEPSWRMFAISYNFIFSIDILGIFVEEEPWITRSSCFKPSRLVSAGNDELFLFLQTSDSVCLS